MATYRITRPALLITTILGGMHALPALANPTGGTVVAGGVKIAGEGTNTVTVTQSTDRAIIDWRSFDIKADETARFVQPRAESITLNRIANGLPTQILGKLEANGNVFIVNGNGVVFGQGSQVNVGGLVVSTADTDGRAFLRSTGQYRFDQPGISDAEIIVEGTINVRNAGVAAFVAPRFSNRGVVRATLGRIAIGAADRFTLDMAGDGLIRFAPADGFGRSSGGVAVENSGVLDASGGLIEISAFAARDAINGSVRVDGMVTAGGATRNADGTVSLTGRGGRIAIGATGRVDVGRAGTLDTSGADGGSITINSLSISNDGGISANGARAGGTVRIDSIGVATLGGQIAATGGDSGGTIAVNAFNIASAGEITATGGTGSGGMIDVIAANRLIATTASRIDASGAAGGSIMVAGGTGTGQGLFSSGTMLADGRTLTGGSIAINGRHIDLVAATGSAEGVTGGGQISVGHERLADGTIAINAATVELSPDTRLSVSALGNGNAGRIDVWSSDLTRAWGSTNARGGALGGDGGFIELSSRGELVFGGTADASAPQGARGLLLLDPRNLTIDDATARFPQYQLLDPNANAGNQFGATVVALSTGNAVVTSTRDDFGATDAGAVYLFNLTTGALISTLRGSTANDFVGNGGVTTLTNGNYVVRTSTWDNGAAVNAGAVTFGNGTTGVSGAVSATNSLVGTTSDDQVGNTGITALTNGNYVVRSRFWDNVGAVDAGAVTFGNGTTGVSGAVSAMNSLVGTTSDDLVGGTGITALTNGNYVVVSINWDNGTATNAGAVTFGSGTTGVSGAVSAMNSLVGTTNFDQVGINGVTALTNGNYVVRSENWSNGAATRAGAVTFGNGTTGVIGAVSAMNSLVGTTTNDLVGGTGITALTNGNYVVVSINWDNGTATNAGAVTFGNGTTGVSGAVSAMNSLVGTATNDLVGVNGITALTNGNYVVRSNNWDNGAAENAGAVTFGNGTTGVSGAVSAMNSLVGTTFDDQVGVNGITLLTNGNYVVRSNGWDNGAALDAGAVTFGNGTTGVSGAVSATNSLVGTSVLDFVGITGITALTNGNYVVRSNQWRNGAATTAGAVTFGSGTTGVSGAVSAMNSLVGTTTNDQVGNTGVTALTNGNYVVQSQNWDNVAATDAGAVTFGSGTTGVSGAVSAMNSLVGTTANDQVSSFGVAALTNGNYVVASPGWDNVAASNAGAVTFGSGTTGVSGAVSAMNSLVGTTANDSVGSPGVTLLTNGNYVVVSTGWDNGAASNAGAVTFGNGTTGVSGAVSAMNSLVGTTTNDGVGSAGVTLLTNGNYVVRSSSWDNVGAVNAGAVTFGSGTTGISGAVSAMNSLVGTTSSDQVGSTGVTALTNGNYVVASANWNNGAAAGAGAVTFGNGTTGVSGVVSATNSLVGTSVADQVGIDGITNLLLGGYLVRTLNWDTVGAVNAGAVTFGSSTTGVSGAVSATNSLVGTTLNAQLAFVTTTPDLVIARSATDGGSGRVYLGVRDLNALTYSRAAGIDITISSAAIRRVLDTGTALTLQANNDITVNSAITVDNPTGNGGAFTLAAGRSIFLNAAITSDNGNVSLFANDLLANGVIDAQRAAGDAMISFGASGSINAGTGNVAIELRDGTGKTNFASGGITLGSVTGAAISVLNTRADASGGITINSGATLTGSGTGNALILSGRSFTNNAGANALTLTGGGRFLVYSNDYEVDVRGGIVGGNLYNRSFATTPPSSVTQTGSQFIFSRQPILTVTANNATREFGLANPTFTGSVTGLVNGDTLAQAVTGALQFTTTATQASNVGSFAINLDTMALISDIGYGFAAVSMPGTLTITQALLSVTANNATREYGLANPAFSGSVTGFRNGDTASVISGLVYASTATQASNVGSFAINGSGASATNYSFAYTPGALTITQALLSVTANNATREYGLANPAFTGSVTGFRNGDTASVISGLVFGSTATQASNVGSFAINGSGASATNYSFAYTPGALTITQALLSVTANNATREYGLANPAFSGSVTGFRNGDTASVISGLVYGSTATQASNVGSFAITGSGASATNYSFAYNPGTLTITQALLSVTANNATRQVNQPNPIFSGTITGFRNSDTASVISGLTFNTTATQASPAGSFAIIGSGASATNYRFTFLPGTLTVQMSSAMPVEVPSFLTRGVQVSQDSQSTVITQATGITGISDDQNGGDTTILIQCVVPDAASASQAVPC